MLSPGSYNDNEIIQNRFTRLANMQNSVTDINVSRQSSPISGFEIAPPPDHDRKEKQEKSWKYIGKDIISLGSFEGLNSILLDAKYTGVPRPDIQESSYKIQNATKFKQMTTKC